MNGKSEPMMMLQATRRRRSRFLFVALIVAFSFFFYQWTSPPPTTTTTILGSDHESTLRPGPSRGPLRFRPSSVDWSGAELFFPPQSVTPQPAGRPRDLPPVQSSSSSSPPHLWPGETAQARARRAAVKDAFVRSWAAYEAQAWTWDELRPVSGGGKNTFGGWAATLVDSLDTLWIMGLYDDFYRAAQVAAELDWANTTETSANLFETTIRHLGGLLSAYDLSGEEALLKKATELGDMLYMAFDTPNGLPGFWMDFNNARSGQQVAGTGDPSASPASLCLEFTRLAQLTGQDKYWSAIERVRVFLYRTQDDSLLPGMWPRQINFQQERVDQYDGFTIGALADSLYEYLPKMYILTGGLAETYMTMYHKAMDTITQHLLFRPMLPNPAIDILFPGDAFVRRDDDGGGGRGRVVDRVPEAQHLGCFAGGMFLLGGRALARPDHVGVGARLARGCAWAYAAFPTGLMPEIAGLLACPTLDPCAWDEEAAAALAAEVEADDDGAPLEKGFRNARDPRYLLRPEAIESIFYLYRVTGDEELRDVAWTMFQSIVKATETPIAYSAISDVKATGETDKMDSMESFWTAETLKYFYLIFSPPDLISLDDWVLNTEAHPFRRPKP